MKKNINQPITTNHPFRLITDEKLVWVGKPDSKAYCLNQILKVLQFLAIITVMMAFCFLTNNAGEEKDWGGSIMFLVIALSLRTAYLIDQLLKLKYEVYGVSDKRLYISTKEMLTSIEITGIVSKTKKQTFIDRRRKTASISIFTGETKETDDGTIEVYDYLESIENADDILMLINTLQTQ